MKGIYMSERTNAIPKPKPDESYAALKNVGLMMGLVERLTSRNPNLPGFGVFHGYSGYGKTMAAIYAIRKRDAIRVEIGDSWTKAVLLRAILHEDGLDRTKGTVAQLADQVKERLGGRQMLLMIDEADKLVDKRMIELVREIQELADCSVILIGEEALPTKLMAVERVHNRVLEWVAAQPCDFADTRKLAEMFAPDIALADDIVEQIRRACDGRARRIVTTVFRLREWCKGQGLAEIDLARYRGGFATGTPPVRRAG
jgi:DNA transposition AAA+ family ATPase